MQSDQFVYWLQGFIEIENPTSLNKKQTQIIKDHLVLVFDKITPDRNEKKVLLEEETFKPIKPTSHFYATKRKKIC